MRRLWRGWIALLGIGLLHGTALGAPAVLIVADEFPAMQRLASILKAGAEADCRLVAQTNLPPSLAEFQTVVVYIHGRLQPLPEQRFVSYAEAGGRLILLHHSISSGKRTNALWFPFLGVELPHKAVTEGGYKWIEPADLQVVNLAPRHFITTNAVTYPDRIPWRDSATRAVIDLAGFSLPESEVYLNHRFSGPRTILLGFRYRDPVTGQEWQQETAGWYRPAGRGWVFYFKPGHSTRDFENAAYARILVNAILADPDVL